MDKIMKKRKISLSGKKHWIVLFSVLAAVAAIVIICCNLGNGSTKPGQDDGSIETIQSKYIDWSVPAECMEFLRYENETTSNTVADMFFLKLGNVEMPIFRFDFGNENAGDWLGMLTVGEERIPVVYTVFMVTDEELAVIDGAEEKYYRLMDVFNEMVQDLTESNGFATERLLDIGDDTEVKMTYWSVTLPEKITVQEKNEGGKYEAIFSGEVVGEMVLLYHVLIGEGQPGVFQGYFKVDGKKMPVYVESYELGERGTWTENDYAVAYGMMDTVNDVLEQIRTSKYFSAK